MAERPTGTVTFLFTDIEGSTSLLRELGVERYGEALENHRRLLRNAFATNGGFEVDTQGDAFFVAFDRPLPAIKAATAAQRALAEHAWPGERALRVRMGIHTAQAAASTEGYVGVGVHRAARICAAGHGGQVLVSHTAHDLIVEELEPGLAFLDLGEHRLKDLSEPHRLFQLEVDGLPDTFPPLRTLENRPTNLPVQATPLIGRMKEVAEVVELTKQPDVRSVTLTGPGGTGKTRLALQAAADLVEYFPDGVFFVTLAAITDPELVVPQVAQTLGLNEAAGQDIGAFLATRNLLLLVDNLEQVIDAAPILARILSLAAGVKLLATSREPLRIAAERIYPVPTLDLPDPRRPSDPSELLRSDGIALFVERARAVKPDFELTAANAPAVAGICVRLDGLPLALELAAARIGLLSPDAMLKRIGERFELLKGGPRDAPTRHRTLTDTLAWSYELLDESERTLFRRLGVFVGGFTLEAAEAVCGAELDSLGSLVDGSLIRREGERFSMLETIREYAVGLLAASPEANALRVQHAAFFVKLAEESFDMRFEREAEHAEELEREHDNLRATLDRLSEVDPPSHLHLAGMLGWFWHAHSHLSEGRARLAEALGATTQRDDDRARALAAAGALAGYQGQLDDAPALVDEAIAIWRESGREQDVALALFDLGWGYFFAGDDASARERMEASLEIQRRLGNPALVNRAQLGVLQILVSQGELDDVPRLGAEAIELSRSLGDAWAEHFAHHFLADCALIEGDHATAADRYALSLDAAARSGDQIETCYELQGIAMAFAGLGRSERALQIAGAADAHLRSLGHVMSIAFWSALLDRYLGKAREDLGPDAEASWNAGRRMTLEDAIQLASSP